MRDVVNNVLVLPAFRKVDEGPGTIGNMQEGAPLLPVSEHLHFVVERTHECENIDNQIEAHSGRVTEKRAISQDDGPPVGGGNRVQITIRIDLGVGVCRTRMDLRFFVNLIKRL